MQLSKQQFNKLSQREKKLLVEAKLLQNAQNRSGKPKKKNRNQSSRPIVTVSKTPRSQGVAAAYSTQQSAKAPAIRATTNHCRIVHREFLGNITGNTIFSVVKQYACNPGLADSFPWLSSQAPAWERYKFHRLKYCYYTRAGSSTAGSVIIASDYDASDTAPLNEMVLTSYQGSVEGSPWKDLNCSLPSSSLQGSYKEHFVRTAAPPVGADVKLYDVANLFVATVDAAADNQPWGKLWVEYDVEFSIPCIPPLGFAHHFFGGEVTTSGATTGKTFAKILGDNPVLEPLAHGLSINGTDGSVNLINMPVGSDIVSTIFQNLAGAVVSGTPQINYGFDPLAVLEVSKDTVVNAANTFLMSRATHRVLPGAAALLTAWLKPALAGYSSGTLGASDMTFSVSPGSSIP